MSTYGFRDAIPCACGCGEPAPRTDRRTNGQPAGTQLRFRNGHNLRAPFRAYPPEQRPAEARFVERVERTDGCWTWKGHRNRGGYGLFYPGKAIAEREMLAHRFAYAMANGPIPEGFHVLHSCDNPPCVNPTHLWLGTDLENMRDASAKGRLRGRNRRLTAEQARSLVSDYRAGGTSLLEVGRRYGVSMTTAQKTVHSSWWEEAS